MGSSNLHVTLSDFAKTYGPLISLRLGTQSLIVASSPDAAIEILKTKDRIFSGRHVPQALPIPKSEITYLSLGWTECNENWKYLRTLCRSELFSNKALESQAKLREEKIVDLMNFLRAKEGQMIKISEVVFTTVFNVLGNAMMSRDFIALEEKNENDGLKGIIRTGVEALAAPNLADFYPILSKLDLQGLRKKSNVLYKGMRDMWEPIIQERRNERLNSIRHQDFLDTLLDYDFTNNRIYPLLTELFSAGADTTTSTIEWTMAELLKNQDSMKKLCEEIEAEIKPDFPKNSHNMQLPYLQACIKETLRLHPPAPFLLPHRALETCQVMNYKVPKNAQVLVNVWAIGRDPSAWKEPLKFKPERFLDSSLDFKGNDFEFLPFGAGRRICPGLPMAAKTVSLVLVSLIHFFEWSLPEGMDSNQLKMEEKFGVTMQMEHPLMLLPKSRK
ncbi:Cytochrome P450 CYP2 subfamily [Handroanthus impetiginosus]|uniref:Cytochrome P450 CYP2 subfamily n=1 Tax=Handroanthus impetiginosus TaxID=429701 RepID=A0A2G9FYD0_9LAMI|nr:Cytochrome P450 CYP2 subfamily [Handroanthus impetiginosus]